MKHQTTIEELRSFGAAWHAQGEKTARAIEEMVASGAPPDPIDQVAAILTLVSAVNGLVGAVLTVGAAVCERLEHREWPSAILPPN